MTHHKNLPLCQVTVGGGMEMICYSGVINLNRGLVGIVGFGVETYDLSVWLDPLLLVCARCMCFMIVNAN